MTTSVAKAPPTSVLRFFEHWCESVPAANGQNTKMRSRRQRNVSTARAATTLARGSETRELLTTVLGDVFRQADERPKAQWVCQNRKARGKVVTFHWTPCRLASCEPTSANFSEGISALMPSVTQTCRQIDLTRLFFSCTLGASDYVNHTTWLQCLHSRITPCSCHP